MNMKDKKYIYIILLVVFILLVSNYKMLNSSVSYTYNDVNNAVEYDNNTINIDFNKLNSVVKNLNGYIEYNDSLTNIYNSIVDYLFNNEKVKMYDSKNKKVLEISFNEAKNVFGNYLKLNESSVIKIFFDENAEDIDLDGIEYKINKEEVTRKRIVETALKEVGKTGETYWNWYGFNHRVEWCCVFVSWVANENKVLNSKIPKFIWVKKGVDYYKSKNQLKKPSEYKPLPGDIIFFDWNNNVVIDHVGIVEKVENGYVYTIEGNVNYLYVKEKKYKLSSPYIYAYGVPDYAN